SRLRLATSRVPRLKEAPEMLAKTAASTTWVSGVTIWKSTASGASGVATGVAGDVCVTRTSGGVVSAEIVRWYASMKYVHALVIPNTVLRYCGLNCSS